MKTTIAFIPVVVGILKAGGYDVDKVINACQAAMNDPETVKMTEGTAKRGAVKGGQTVKADGSLKVDSMKWNEQITLDYEAKYTAPIEFVKWHDSLQNHFKKTGQPTGDLPVELVPMHVRDWLDTKFKLVEGKAIGKAGKNGKAEPVTA